MNKLISRLWARLINPFRRPIVRVWRLGSLEHRILPTQEAIDKLAGMLLASEPGHDMDIIWDDAIDVIELKGTGAVNIVTGPGIRVTRAGNVVKVEKDD